MLIPVPEDFDLTENDLTGFCIKTEQDELHDTDNDIIYIDGIPYYMIVSNHFSDWAIADLDDGQAGATVEDRLKSAATSDNYGMHYAWLSFLISSALLACFTFMKKRNYKK